MRGCRLAAARSDRARLLVVLGALAAFGALAASTSFATADEISGAGEWVEVGVVAALLAVAVVSLRRRWSSLRIWAAAGIGVVAATFSAGSLGVFVHGYVISTLPAAAARLAVLLAVVAGMATALLSVSVGIERIPVQPAPAGTTARAEQTQEKATAVTHLPTRPDPYLLEAPDEDIPSH